MEIEYLDGELRCAVTSRDGLPPGWTEAEVSRVRLIVQCVRAALVPSYVLSLWTLHLRENPDIYGSAMAELSANRAVVLAFKAERSPTIAMIDVVLTRMDSENE